MFTRIVLIVTMIVTLMTISNTAQAKNYKWNNTKVTYFGQSIKVGWCSGGTAIIKPSGSTSKDVCKVWLPYNKMIDVWVKETGTDLFVELAYCGTKSGKWITFNSRTDTSRTAVVYMDNAMCA